MRSCPNCGATDLFRKASIIHESGAASTQGKFSGGGVSVGTGGISAGSGGGDFSAATASRLAERLAPPPPPFDDTSLEIGCLASVTVFLGVIVALLQNTVTVTLFLAILAADIFYAARPEGREERARKNAEEYEAALARWSALWVCLRCGEQVRGSDPSSDTEQGEGP